MAEEVEARSLSTLNYLAANPPQYPVNPSEERQDSLVLYISRVPGTRDVILSTFKPQRKNVTREDIANSLYYVHLNQLTDSHLADQRAPDPHASSRPSTESGQNTAVIQRKPLPSGSKLATQDAPQSLQHEAPSVFEVTRNTIPTEGSYIPPGYHLEPSPQFELSANRPALLAQPEQPLRTGAVPRKPVGPRAMDNAKISDREGLPSSIQLKKNNDDPFFASSAHFSPPSSHCRPYATATSPPKKHSDLNTASRSVSPSKGIGHTKLVPFCLSLIRRDPSSGNQWNIGRVSSYQAEAPLPESPSQGLSRPPSPETPIQPPSIKVEIETSGYVKFRGFPTNSTLDQYRPKSAASLSRSVHDAAQHVYQDSNAEDFFTRQISMAYGRDWAANIRKAFQRHDRARSADRPDIGYGLDPPKAPGMHARHGSEDSHSSTDSVRSTSYTHIGQQPSSSPPLATSPGAPPSSAGGRAKGYEFTSPWDGRCEFRTGSGGRSVKCRHTLDSNSTGFNPLVIAQGLRDGQGFGRNRGRSGSGSMASAITGAYPVSELRFNLPNGELFGGRKGSRDLPARIDKFLNLGHTTEDGDDEPYDLELGKEAAGGGSRGKRAKLGKLIVHNDGLKMLDLVVAANMGVWWTTWERKF